MRLGGTAFDKLDVSLALDDGRARVQRGAITSRGVTAELDGLIDLVAQVGICASMRCRRTRPARNRSTPPT